MIDPLKSSSFRLNKAFISYHVEQVSKRNTENMNNLNSNVFYIYKMQSGDICQIGLICMVSFSSKSLNTIFPHELTLRETENLYFDWLNNTGEQLNPVVFVHEQRPKIKHLMNSLMEEDCSFFSATKDQVTHTVWEITNPNLIELIVEAYTPIDNLYIADGHHRVAAAKRLGEIKPWLNHIAALLIPHDQINISSFHRILHLGKKISKSTFLNKIEKHFYVHSALEGFQPYDQHEFGVYIEQQWFSIQLREDILQSLQGRECIGTSILETYILALFSKSELQYCDGSRGLNWLETEVDGMQNAIGFSVAPISIQDFLQTANQGILLPARSTYFLPKPLNDIIHYSMDLVGNDSVVAEAC